MFRVDLAKSEGPHQGSTLGLSGTDCGRTGHRDKTGGVFKQNRISICPLTIAEYADDCTMKPWLIVEKGILSFDIAFLARPCTSRALAGSVS